MVEQGGNSILKLIALIVYSIVVLSGASVAYAIFDIFHIPIMLSVFIGIGVIYMLMGLPYIDKWLSDKEAPNNPHISEI